MGTLSTITAPTIEPVTLTEAKSVLGITHTTDDTLITAYIEAARQFAEAYTQLKIMTQVLEWTFEEWPAWGFGLDIWPLISIDSIKYDDTSSPITEQTLVSGTDYYSSILVEGGWVESLGGWPSTTTRPSPIRVRATAGYADTAASPEDLRDGVPEGIKTGIKLYVKFLYNSDPCSEAAARSVLWHFRRNI